MGCAVTTGFGVINNNARLKIGESIVIIGAGGIGLSIIQGAQLSSAHPIIAVDIHDQKLRLARRLGATHGINARKKEVRREVLRIVGTRGCDVAVDNTGSARMIEAAYELTAGNGRTVLVGVPGRDQKARIYTLPLHFEKTIKGSHGGEADPSRDIPRYVNLYLKGKLPLERLITHRFDFRQINKAIAMIRRGAITGRCMITFNH